MTEVVRDVVDVEHLAALHREALLDVRDAVARKATQQVVGHARQIFEVVAGHRALAVVVDLGVDPGVPEEGDRVHVRQLRARALQAEVDRARWKVAIVLLAREAFFLRGAEHFAVADDARRSVVRVIEP